LQMEVTEKSFDNRKRKSQQPLVPRKRNVDDSKGCEPELGDRKVQRTQLDVSNISSKDGGLGRQAWLVKVPPSVCSAWEKMEEGKELGELLVKKIADKNEEVLEVRFSGLKAEMSGGKKVALPNYTLRGIRQVNDSLIFNQSKAGLEKGGGVKMHSSVVRAYNMQPVKGTAYRSLMQNRMVAATVKQQYVKSTEPPKKSTDSTQRHIFDLTIENDKRKKAEAVSASLGMAVDMAVQGGKKVKIDRTILRGKLFEFFSLKEQWTLKDLNARLNQPDEHLKLVLKEIADLHRTGLYRNNYELKMEYKSSGALSSTERKEAV